MCINFVANTMQRKVKPLHPGSIIVDVLEDRGIKVNEFCKGDCKLKEILESVRPITYLCAVKVDLRLGISSQLLMNLQRKVDIWDSSYETN